MEPHTGHRRPATGKRHADGQPHRHPAEPDDRRAHCDTDRQSADFPEHLGSPARSVTVHHNAPTAGATSLDGPTLHVNLGGKIDLTFCNELGNYQNAAGKMVPLLANMHYHGLHVEPNVKADNIFRTFGPGESKSFVNVPTDQPAGTYWYHVHYHGLSEREVMGGSQAC